MTIRRPASLCFLKLQGLFVPNNRLNCQQNRILSEGSKTFLPVGFNLLPLFALLTSYTALLSVKWLLPRKEKNGNAPTAIQKATNSVSRNYHSLLNLFL